MPDTPDEFRAHDRAIWEQWAEINYRSASYNVEGFKQGGVRILPFEIEEVGDVAGKDLLHLQCHFGLDTLSWARLGANVTGVDFSERAITRARGLAAEIGQPARFVCADVLDLTAHLEGQFDVVYTSYGVLGWLSDLKRWAEVIAHFLRPGGVDRRRREVQTGDLGALPRPGQRVEPEVALEVDEGATGDVGEFLALERTESGSAREECRDVVEVARDVDGDPLVPHRPVEVTPPLRLVLRTAHAHSSPLNLPLPQPPPSTLAPSTFQRSRNPRRSRARYGDMDSLIAAGVAIRG